MLHRMRGRNRRWPLWPAAAMLLVLTWNTGAAERSRSGSDLHTGGGDDSISPPLVIPRFSEAEVDIRLDGSLDDAVWARVPAYDRMTLVRPDRGGTGRYRTQTFIFYTERGLYVGAWNEQPSESLTPRLAGRDGWGTGDAYQVMIDSSGNGRYGYWFMVVLGGTLADGHLMPERRFSSNWDGPWAGETVITDDGWTVEMFLPWSMIDMPAVAEGERRMGLLVTRDLAAIHERWAWPGLSWTQPKFISAFQPITFEGVAPTQEISVFPYASHLTDIARDASERTVGIDVFWRPSTAFLLNAAVNPDFGQVEADDIIVNLSAYETFLQEKRLFFTENQEVFSGSIDFAPTLLHTRRIGSSVGSRHGGPDFEPGVFFDSHDTGKPVDLLFAAKGVGQIGNWRWGALGAAEDDTRLAFADGTGSADADGRNFGVMRWQRESTAGGGRRAIGWMATVADHPERRASSQGVDAHYSTMDAKWTWDGQLFVSDVPAGTGSGGLGVLQWAPRRGDSHVFRADYYGDQLDLNDLGYLWRNDYGGVAYSFDRRNQRAERFREVRTQFSTFADFNGDGRRIGTVFDAGRSWLFRDGEGAWVRANYRPGHWDDRNSRGNGDYRVGRTVSLQGGWSSDSSKRLFGNVAGSIQTESEGGWYRSLSFGAVWRPVDRITLAPVVSYTNRDAWILWQHDRYFEAFKTEQWSPRIQFDAFFTARQQLRVQVEWTGIKAIGARRLLIDDDGKLVGSGTPTERFSISRMTVQVRYRWQIAPLSDLFVVYNRNGSLFTPSIDREFSTLLADAFEDPQREALLVKVRYRFGK